jgi:hypothetical protein
MKPDYTTYTAIDLALDDAFIEYVLFNEKRNELFWEKLIQENPQKKQDLEQATKMIFAIQRGMSAYAKTHLSEEKENELLYKIQTTIQQKQVSVTLHQKRKILPLLMRVAAIFLLITGIASYFLYPSSKGTYREEVNKLEIPYHEYANTSLIPDTLILPDQSQVILQPQSKIAYVKSFNDTLRTVILHGKAQFSVVKDAQKPFIVLANQVTTRVLGTVFDVEAYEDRNEVKVTVKEGKVAISKMKDQSRFSAQEQNILLQANQVIHYQLSDGRYTKRLVDAPQRLPFTNHITMQYESTSLKTVFEDIQQAYGIPIVYDATSIRHCQLTASLSNEDFADLLKIICISVGLKYEILETSVIITGKGCPSPN